MRLHTTVLTIAMLALAAVPVAAQGRSIQQRLNEEHAAWHRKHDRDAYRNPAKYRREHAREHEKLNRQYQQWARRTGTARRYGYVYPQQYPYGYTYPQQYPYGYSYPQQYPYGYQYPQRYPNRYGYPQNGNGWYDGNGHWHQNPVTSGGWYDRSGRWHPAGQSGVYVPNRGVYPYVYGQSRGRNPKAEGRHDNGRHNGWYRNGRGRDDD